MKTFIILFTAALMFFTIAAEEKEPQAQVNFKKSRKSVEYKISFIPGYQYNHEAPFRFNLLDRKKEVMTKVPLDDFKKEKDGSYIYSSNGKERFVNYWFVACKYVDGEITGCRTFTDTIEIK